jgi:hypothetical protein
MKNTLVKLHIDETIEPQQNKLKKIPIQLREKVENEITSMLENDLIEVEIGPTTWISPIVSVPKSDGSIRICTDEREPNRAIKRERHPSPT